MNHMTARVRAGPPGPRGAATPPGGRPETRARVIDAARRLFSERGFEPATVRDIAAAAGLSTGAVFAHFTDKNDLFNAVMSEDLERQMDIVDARPDKEEPIEAALNDLYGRGYAFHIDRLPLLQAAAGLSWSQGLGGELGDRPVASPARRRTAEWLGRAAARGELKPDADVELLAELIWQAYMANYRGAMFGDWGLEVLKARFAAQLKAILAGAKPH